MEGRKEAFRMYLEESGATSAVTKCIIKLYEAKDKRPETPDEAFKFMKDNLSNDFPSQEDYDKLLKQVEESRVKVADIKRAEKIAKEAAKKRAEERAKKRAAKAARNSDWTIEAKELLDEFKGKTSSLLIKHLTADMIDALKTDETSTGKTLLDCIEMGLENPNLPVGIYAADFDAYDKFAQIFNPIIADYHGCDAHTIEDDWGTITDILGQGMYQSVRMACSRSLKNYPFNPAMSEAQFVESMNEVKAALDDLEDPYKGTFKELRKFKDSEKPDLIANKQLFESSDTTKFWPKGRAVFMNSAKSLIVWVNEEDHLKFISTGGPDEIEDTFNNLKEMVSEISGRLEFKKHPRLGYLTLCPTKLGSTIHASVTIELPNLHEYYTDIQTMARQKINLKISVEPSIIDGEYEVANKQKLGVSEIVAIRQMQEAVQQLLKEEESIVPIQPVPTTIDDAKVYLDSLRNDSHCHSLLVQHLDDALFNTLKNEAIYQTTAGKGLLDCIKLGLEDPNLPVGVYAPDMDAYVKFAELFDPIISTYHDFDVAAALAASSADPSDPTKKHPNNWDLSAVSDLDPNLLQYIKSTRIACSRSIAELIFVTIMNGRQFDFVMNKFQVALTACANSNNSELHGGVFRELNEPDDMDEDLKQIIKEYRLFEMNKPQLAAAESNGWPKGRGIFTNPGRTLLVVVNDKDHVKFISTNKGDDIQRTLARLKEAVADVEDKLATSTSKSTFAKSDHLGWITSCPTNIGSTIHASTMVKLTSLRGYYAGVKELAENKMKLNIRVELSATDDDVYEISNKQKLGLSEADAVMQMREGVMKLLEIEKHNIPFKTMSNQEADERLHKL